MNSIMVGFALPNKQSVSNITTFKIYGFLVCCHSRYHATHAVKSKVLSVYGDMEVKLHCSYTQHWTEVVNHTPAACTL